MRSTLYANDRRKYAFQPSGRIPVFTRGLRAIQVALTLSLRIDLRRHLQSASDSPFPKSQSLGDSQCRFHHLVLQPALNHFSSDSKPRA